MPKTKVKTGKNLKKIVGQQSSADKISNEQLSFDLIPGQQPISEPILGQQSSSEPSEPISMKKKKKFRPRHAACFCLSLYQLKFTHMCISQKARNKKFFTCLDSMACFCLCLPLPLVAEALTRHVAEPCF